FSYRVTPNDNVVIRRGNQTGLFDFRFANVSVIDSSRHSTDSSTGKDPTTTTCRQDMLETGKQTIFYVRWRRGLRRTEMEHVVHNIVGQEGEEHEHGDDAQGYEEQSRDVLHAS